MRTLMTPLNHKVRQLFIQEKVSGCLIHSKGLQDYSSGLKRTNKFKTKIIRAAGTSQGPPFFFIKVNANIVWKKYQIIRNLLIRLAAVGYTSNDKNKNDCKNDNCSRHCFVIIIIFIVMTNVFLFFL